MDRLWDEKNVWKADGIIMAELQAEHGAVPEIRIFFVAEE